MSQNGQLTYKSVISIIQTLKGNSMKNEVSFWDQPMSPTHIRIVMTTCALLLIVVIGGIISMIVSDEKTHSQEIKDCKGLDAKYGEFFKPYTGPFSDVKMIAVQFSPKRIGLKPFMTFIQEPSTEFFRCSEVERIK